MYIVDCFGKILIRARDATMATVEEGGTLNVPGEPTSGTPVEDTGSGPGVQALGEGASLKQTQTVPLLEWYKRKQLVGYKEWVPRVAEHTLRTEFVDLSPSDLEALANGSTVAGSGKVEEDLKGLEKKIDAAIATLGSSGVSVRLNVASPKDAAQSFDKLSSEDQDDVRLQVMNQVELERQLGTAADCRRRGTFVRSFQGPEAEGIEGEEQQRRLPRSTLRRQAESELHETLRAKEPLENVALRALSKVLVGRLQVQSGREALTLLGSSSSVQYHLKQIRNGNPSWDSEVVLIYLVIREWVPDIPRHPEMHLRGFVYKNSLTALSQIDDITFFPNLVKHKTGIQQRVEAFFKESVSNGLLAFESYVIDFFVGPEKVLVTRLLPFHHSTGACLFTWRESEATFQCVDDTPLEFRTINHPKADCRELLPSMWENTMLRVVTELGKLSEEKERGCLIL